jgi:5'-nucleotidase
MRQLVAVVVAAVLATFGALAPAGAAPLSPMRVLVTNDDGVGAPGIDALVHALSKNPNLDITVIAPATNQSGTGDDFSTGPINVFPSSTAGAFPATAVAGFPADTVYYAVTYAMPVPPDLVVSGINLGQNVGNLADISGTVGAALTAARFHIPAIALSTALGANVDYTEAANYAAALVERFRVSRSLQKKLSPPKERRRSSST